MDPTDPRKLDWPMPAPADDGAGVIDHEALQRAAEGIREDLQRVPGQAADAFIDLLARCFEDSPAPEESVAGIERILHHDPSAAPEFIQAALRDHAAFRRLFLVLGHSRALGRHIARGGWRAVLALDDANLVAPVEAAAVASAVRARIAGGDEVQAALRRTHNEGCTRVLLREVSLRRPVEEICHDVSALADGALGAALEAARAEFRDKRGWVEPQGFRFCVVALGKLGAGELNYSSDIDLMFLFEGDGPAGISGQKYAIRLAERVIALVDEITEDGFVFRVDTRLRPEGKLSALARTPKSCLDYYYSFGSTWERQALLKARPCAGETGIGVAMLAGLQNWIFRKYLTVEEINALQDVKRSIERRTDERAQTFSDIKTGFGGIRDIEFAVQFLQLLNGGRMVQVRTPATLDALNTLAANGVLRRSEADELANAYRFLRGLEHRLQAWEMQQTHTLPTDAGELVRLGRAMGFKGARLDPARQMLSQLGAHTLRSRGLMERLFAGLFGKPASEESRLVLDTDMGVEDARPVLQRYRFNDVSGAFAAVKALAQESAENRLYAPRARKYLASMMPALLDYAGQSPDPDATLRNFERIAANLGAKTMLFELVAEDPRALALFGGIAAHSDWLSDILARRPGLVDEFIDSLQTFAALDRARLKADLRARPGGVREAASSQRDAELLRIGLFDITGRTPLPETLRELCVVAEVILDAVLEDALAQEIRRNPSLLAADPRSYLAVIGMGKLGSGALNYASDLDLVFAYEPGALRDPAAEQAFWSRVVRAVIDALTTQGEFGRLYDVDLRLRPHGGKGTLAVTLEELRRYLASDAAFWERIAACRSRVVVQSPSGERAGAILQEFCYGAGADARAMRDMRERLRTAAKPFDLKRGEGGTLDIEFTTAHLQMTHGGNPGLRSPDVFAALAECRKAGLIDGRDHDEAAEAYAFLRQALNRMQLLDGKPHDEIPAEGLETFARRMGYGGQNAAAQLTEELQWHRTSARRVFDRYVT